MADTSTPVRSRRLSSRIIVNGPRRRSPFRRPAIIVLELLGLLAFWHLAVVTFEWVNPLFYPPPGKVLGALGDLWEEGVLAKNIRFSVTVWGKGYLIGAVSGVAFGVLMGTSNATYRLGAPIVWSLWATPLIALRPMTAVWFGFGDRPIIFLVFLGTFFPIALNTAAGAREVDGSLIRSARVFGANRWEEFRKIRLPWTRPYIFAGMRLAIPTSIIALLIGELLGSSKGLGAMITLNTSRFRTDRTFAVILVLVLLSVTLVQIVEALDRRHRGGTQERTLGPRVANLVDRRGGNVRRRTFIRNRTARRLISKAGWNAAVVVEIGIVVLVWEFLISGLQLWNSRLFPPPSALFSAFVDLVSSGRFGEHWAFSMKNALYGFLLATVVGIAVGLVMSSSRWIDDILGPPFWTAYSTPRIALQPLLVIWMGFGSGPKILIIFLMAVFPVALNTMEGLRTVDRSLLRAAEVYGANRLQRFVKVELPAAVPLILTGIRMGVARAMVGVVVGEFIGGSKGLGYLIDRSAFEFELDTALALTVLLVVMANIGMFLVDVVRRVVAPWYSMTA
jgi:NitT/TauT family transport system permease protein|tara:strand:+ start:2396 stop:4084 length:1689 start_codon:yes stop_codon:yes gene_type:complete